jgi:hypothetical protein
MACLKHSSCSLVSCSCTCSCVDDCSLLATPTLIWLLPIWSVSKTALTPRRCKQRLKKQRSKHARRQWGQGNLPWRCQEGPQ